MDENVAENGRESSSEGEVAEREGEAVPWCRMTRMNSTFSFTNVDCAHS
jgi:hypothetical protein